MYIYIESCCVCVCSVITIISVPCLHRVYLLSNKINANKNCDFRDFKILANEKIIFNSLYLIHADFYAILDLF